MAVAAFSPVCFVSAEGKGEVGCYFLKVLQCNVTVLALVVVLHYRLQGATEQSDPRLSQSGWFSSALGLPSNTEVKEGGRLLHRHILTSTICLTCLEMVSGSSLGVTPEPHSATTGALTGATGCGATDALMRH